MHNSWIRIVRQVNYRRSFPTPTSARVEIPCIPYEAIDHTGNVTPKSLLSLIESIRACTFWRNTSTSEPERCFLKIHDLLEKHIVFIASVRLTITDRSLYDSTVVKQPLYSIFSLTNAGKSSKNLNCKLFHSDTNKQFVSCDVADVLVDPETRKPTPIPTWWTDEFGKGIPTFKRPDPPFSDVEKNGDLYQSETKVMYSDTDSYQHCNWTSYMKFSYDSMMDHLIRGGGYDWVTLDDVKAGIRDVDILYRSEAMLGDTLTVQSWSTRGDKCENKEKSLLFNVLNVGTSCFQAKMTFFSPNPSLNAHSAL